MTGLPDSVRQTVSAEAGYAYGVIGADLHVFPGRGPAYLLANHVPATPDRTLPAQPSYLLDARSAVVDFTGRRGEVGDLTAWRDSDHARAVRWLHAPGGQGKTRLANHLAATSPGWKVIVADHAAGRVDARNATSQDLRIGDATGLLLVVDYADRWPLSHLTWLFGNAVLTQDVPVRVLLLARTTHVWPALRHALVQAGWPSCTTQRLGPEDSRDQMFTAARDGFARCYGLADPEVIAVPDGLARNEFGLTLAVHMAALVAVDRHAGAGEQAPLDDVPGLTAYLLDRERHHWHTLYDTGASRDTAGGRATFATTPDLMSRAVFVAALTGPLGYRDATAALAVVGADQALADHTFCYPPADQRTVLQPLYPDRLAEDFLALCLPGHDVPGPWAGAWAEGAPERLLDGAPPYTSRAITFLAAASDRWPHLIPTLAALEPLVANTALTIAAADLTERLATHRLATVTDPAERAAIHVHLGRRLGAADRNDKAVAAFEEAVRVYREVAPACTPELAEALVEFAGSLIRTGPGEHWTTAAIKRSTGNVRPPPERRDEAKAVFGEAVEIYRGLLRQDRPEHEVAILSMELAGALAGLERWEEALTAVGVTLSFLGQEDTPARVTTLDIRLLLLERLDRPDEALAVAAESVAIRRRLAQENPDGLRSYSRVLYNMARHDEAIHALREAVGVARRLAQANPGVHMTALRSDLEQLVEVLIDQSRWAEALTAAHETVQISRRLAESDPDRHADSLACNLSSLALVLRSLARREEEAAALDEATTIRRRLAAENPGEHEHVLSIDLSRLGTVLAEMGRWHDALTATTEAVGITEQGLSVEAHFTAAAGILTGDFAAAGLREAIKERRRRMVDDNPAGRLYRQLTGTDPLTVADRPQERPASLGAQAMTLRSLGRHEEALPLAYEATEIYRQLARNDPGTYEPALAEAWLRMAVIVAELGVPSTAPLEIAIDIRRRLVRHDRVRHEPALAADLAIMARTLARQGQQTAAMAAATESVEIRRRLGETGEFLTEGRKDA